ncbi:hypothetical protein CIPAW_08G160200 [Carya illinoinensis]|uniref:Uncharacterized protein n=1 Tax=Carya illinoinensis TaxID=32201 RepID=A0A8T1Q0A9_CARIL|nr:hypothetical protein CIPAW_08G160200 [Carya illinoinensis]
MLGLGFLSVLGLGFQPVLGLGILSVLGLGFLSGLISDLVEWRPKIDFVVRGLFGTKPKTNGLRGLLCGLEIKYLLKKMKGVHIVGLPRRRYTRKRRRRWKEGRRQQIGWKTTRGGRWEEGRGRGREGKGLGPSEGGGRGRGREGKGLGPSRGNLKNQGRGEGGEGGEGSRTIGRGNEKPRKGGGREIEPGY